MKKYTELQKQTIFWLVSIEEEKKFKAGLIIMNKYTAVHTCNACNKTFRKIYIEDCTLNQIMVLLLWNSQQRSKLFRMPHTHFLTMLKVYKILFCLFKRYYTFFLYILPGYTKKRCPVTRHSLNSQSVK